ncbi:DUF211 domain-containing protein [Haloarcula onubensis]|uniref:DUF211 domain-containing protein n=1 Tax=Haloarcula onubensis TaxID=2950539 RepID=A0ABU2FUW7_9EURY|nr:DUF211 domain-containing protein [Halomicroarcula sp. S3CR25-11]MDS0284558.1 DUF211 domain-containing protein [Halomicroarcula sp. S3CR25-11]
MAPVKRLVVDILKPHDPPLAEFTGHVADVGSVDGATASLIELDKEVQNVKLTAGGDDVDVDEVEAEIEALGGTVHSVDQVSCGERVVEDRPIPQDR